MSLSPERETGDERSISSEDAMRNQPPFLQQSRELPTEQGLEVIFPELGGKYKILHKIGEG
jgi:hypothetical protein